MALLIRRLQRQDATAAFDCGDAALNSYLARYALQNQERHRVGITYVAVEDQAQDAVLGYYTLASASVPRQAWADEAVGRRLSPYADVPCLLLGRLAVDRRAQGRGVGQLLLRDALNRAVAIGGAIGCRGVVVDAYPSALRWYGQFGFVPLAATVPEAATQKLFLDLRTVERELGSGNPASYQ